MERMAHDMADGSGIVVGEFDWPERFEVEVTTADIENGEAQDSRRCPISRAVNRFLEIGELPGDLPDTGYSDLWIVDRRQNVKIRYRHDAVAFVCGFDSDGYGVDEEVRPRTVHFERL